MSWQKRARFGVAIFGIVGAGVVYSAIGERRATTPPPALKRLDPKALVESTAGVLKQVRGEREDYAVTFERQLTYQGGRTKLLGVRVSVKNRDGRDFEVTAKEAEAGENQRDLRLSGDVRLAASDGFELTTDTGVYNQDDGIVRAAGKVLFKKDRMNGYGTNTTYDQKTDVLTIAMEAHVEMHDADNNVTLDFDAASATLDRMQDLLVLDGAVHALREEQTIETDHAVAHLDADDQVITLLELRGNARVQGTGGSLDAMSARDIDLQYTQDGKTLERVVLAGAAAIALTAQNGAPGRSITGESMELHLAPDRSLTRTIARQNVRLVLPSAEGTPARSIQANALDATGEEGKGLTAARFTDAVEFREQPAKGAAMRTVHSRVLQVVLTESSVGDATFTGTVTFEAAPLRASAAEVQYLPDAGRLQLQGSDSGGGPRVADDQITIDAQAITVGLEGRQMTANGSVKSTLRPRPPAPPAAADRPRSAATERDRESSDAGHIPGLLKQDQPVNVNAGALQYEGGAGRAIYTGEAALWQGDTSVRADTLIVDQQNGDLMATGSARATIALETGTSIGRAHEIRYDDARHAIVYSPPTAPAPTGAAGRGAAAPAPIASALQPQLSGPQGDLRADRVEVFLAAGGGKLERLEASTNVTMQIDPATSRRRTASGGHLTYRAASDQYDLVGTAASPVKVVESCREITGKTLTFYKSTDRITVDGNEEIRTETKTGGPCPQSGSPRPSRP